MEDLPNFVEEGTWKQGDGMYSWNPMYVNV